MTKSDSHPDPKSFLGVGSCKRIQIQTDPNSQVAKLCDRFHTKNNFYPTFYIYSILLFYCMYREKSTNLPSRTKFLKHFPVTYTSKSLHLRNKTRFPSYFRYRLTISSLKLAETNQFFA